MENKIKIWFGNDIELKLALLQKMEANGVVWMGSGKAPTRAIPSIGHYFYVHDGRLQFGLDREAFEMINVEEISAYDYIGINESEINFNENDFLSLLN
jgi:hypothetical protein